MTWLRLLATSPDEVPLPLQLGIALPLCVVLVQIGRWAMSLIKELIASKDAMATKLADEVTPTLAEVSVVLRQVLEFMEHQQRRGPK